VPTAQQQGPSYQLSGDKLQKAIRVSRIRSTVHFVQAGWGILTILVLLILRIPARLRDWAVSTTSRFRLQCLIVLAPFLILTTLLSLPIDAYMQHVNLSYGLSIQGWASWLWDQTKEFLISFVALYLLVMLLFFVLRRSPRNWWLWFWAASVPITIFAVFITPVFIDPLFNEFEPLQQSNPALVTQLEKVIAHGGLEIPQSRMFLMKASAKTTRLNAYVTGVGTSKRVVVWDTSIAKATPDEISYIFGHEMGHYVLHHIWIGMTFSFVLVFLVLRVAYLVVNWIIRRFGATWSIPSPQDWAAIGIFFLILNTFAFLLEPITNGFSRWEEHQADIYGQEAIHGIVADPPHTALTAFQVLGETSLVDPNPNAFVEFWTGSHPSIASRAAFAASYDPWQPGQHPKYFTK